MRLTTDRKLPV